MPTSATFGINDTVQVRNLGSHHKKLNPTLVNENGDLTFSWDNQKHVVRSGEVGFVPVVAVMNVLGDPRSVGDKGKSVTVGDVVHWIPGRVDEIRRLNGKYGNPADNEMTIEPIDPPNVEVYTQNGDRIYTVAEDPQGEFATASTARSTDQAAEIAELRRIVADLQGRVGSGKVTEADLPIDGGEAVAPKRGTRIKDLEPKDPE